MTRRYPVALDLEGRRVVVVGGGSVATRRIVRLIASGALVDVVATSVTEELAELRDRDGLSIVLRAVVRGDLDGASLVLAATDDRELNQRVLDWTDAIGAIGVGVHDEPASGRLPAVVEGVAVSAAIWTEPTAPAVATWVRDRIAVLLDDRVQVLAEVAAELRSELLEAGVTPTGAVWHEALDAGMLAGANVGSRAELKECLRACLSSS